MELSYGSKWILPPDFHGNRDCFIEYIDYFDCEQTNVPVQIRVSAFNQYALWINNRFVFLSSFTNCSGYNFYDNIDITEYILPGQNALRIICMYKYTQLSSLSELSSGLIFDILSDMKCILVSSVSTLSRYAAEYKTSTTLGFSYDSRLKDTNKYMKCEAFSSKAMLSPRAIQGSLIADKSGSKINSHGLFVYSPLQDNSNINNKLKSAFISDLTSSPIIHGSSPSSFKALGDNYKETTNGIFITFDLEKEHSGFLEFDFSAHEGTCIYITHSHSLSGNVADFRFNTAGKFISTQGRNKLTYFFNQITCRYITLYIEAYEIDIFFVGIRTTQYSLVQKADFLSSDLLHNKIYSSCMNTLSYNIQNLYNNIYNQEHSADFLASYDILPSFYYAYDNYQIAKEALILSANSINDAGFISCGNLFNGQIAPAFSLLWIIRWQEYIHVSGDVIFAREAWHYAEKIIRAFWRNSKGRDLQSPFMEDNFINFYDDVDGLNSGFLRELRNKNNIDNFDGILSILYIMSIDALIKASKFIYAHLDVINKSQKQYDNIDFVEKISWCEMLLSGALNNFHSTFWDNSVGAYCTYVVNGEKLFFCEFMNSLALYANIVPEKYKKRIAEILSENDKCFPSLIPCSLNTALVKYLALLDYNNSYFDFVLSQIASK